MAATWHSSLALASATLLPRFPLTPSKWSLARLVPVPVDPQDPLVYEVVVNQPTRNLVMAIFAQQGIESVHFLRGRTPRELRAGFAARQGRPPAKHRADPESSFM